MLFHKSYVVISKYLLHSQDFFMMTQIWELSSWDRSADFSLRTARKERQRYCPFRIGTDSRITSMIITFLSFELDLTLLQRPL